MLDNLKVYNFLPTVGSELHNVQDFFVLKTCQRILYVGVSRLSTNPDDLESKFTGKEAYNYLLEVICGLQSRLVGENEVVGQFKDSYKAYVQHDEKNPEVLLILEKLFQDAKYIRTNFLMGICQKTYASIARKHLINKFKADDVLIMGSGQLAEDLVNQFKKKANVYVTARDSKKLQELKRTHGINIVEWDSHVDWRGFAFIANSIGFDGVLLDQDFFHNWAATHTEKLFVDLGSPSSIETHFDYDSGVMKLEDVFSEGAIKEKEKCDQIELARKAIQEVVVKRHSHLKEKKTQKQNRSLKLNYAY